MKAKMKSPFKFVEHKTVEDWHAWRDQRIGASDISFIMGVSPYKSRAKLLHEKKTGQKEDGPEFIFKKGHDFEAAMRPKSEIIFDLDLNPANVEPVGTKFDEFLSASLDGFDIEKNIIWECKLVGKDVFNEIKESQKPPHKYAYQIQQQLLITQAKHCILCYGLSLSNYDHIIVKPDKEKQKQLIDAAKEFWKDWNSDLKPPEGFSQTMQEFYDLNEIAKQAKKKADEAKKKLAKFDYGHNYENGGFLYSKTVSFRSNLDKEKVLKIVPEEKHSELYKDVKAVSYAVKKVKCKSKTTS